MLRRMSAIQWQHWKMYMRLDPITAEREDVRTGLVREALWNVQIAKATRKGQQPAFRDPADFIPRFGDAPERRSAGPTRKQTAQEQWDTLVAIFKSYAKPKQSGKGPVNG